MANFNSIFIEYYNLYRGDGSTPTTTDPEYTIALRLANTAINTWLGDPGFLWNELFTRLQLANDGSKVLTGTTVNGVFTATSIYPAPSDMIRTGGFILLTNPATLATTHVKPYQPWEIQNLNPSDAAAYFIGDPNTGFELNIQGNFLSDQSWNNANIDYVYYKQPTVMTQGNDVPEMSDTEYMVNFMLAQRYRNSMNWPAYQTAMRDAQNALKNMETIQNSGTNFNPWELSDPTGSHVGVAFGR